MVNMRFKYGDRVKVKDDFWGEFEGTVIDYEIQDGIYVFEVKYMNNSLIKERFFVEDQLTLLK